MRKIEEDMLSAIRDSRSVILGNTTVTTDIPTNVCKVYLHNNLLGTVVNNTFTLNNDVLLRFPTNTTKSRLRALGLNITTVKGVTYIDGKEFSERTDPDFKFTSVL